MWRLRLHSLVPMLLPVLLCSPMFVGCDRSDSSTPATATAQSEPATVDPAPAPAQPASPPGPFRFASMNADAGIDFVQTSGDSADKPFPAANGTGCGVVDVDLDGHPDVYFANGATFPLNPQQPGPWDRLYRNRGHWKWTDITAVAGIGSPGYSCGIATGDVDSDGFPDVYVTRYGRNQLYRNLGDGTYEELAAELGADDDGWATSAAIFDANHDGLADIYVCNYGQWTFETSQYCGDKTRNLRMFCSPRHVPPQPDVLLVNNGQGFTDQLQQLGASVAPGRGQGVLAGDFDGDALTDLYVANDIHPNFLLINSNNGFREIGEASGIAFDHLGQAQAGMGLAASDVDSDGRFELFVTNYQNEHNALYLNLGDQAFLEAGLTRIPEGSMPWVGWGNAFADFDLDGRADLIVTNGHTDNNLAEFGKEGDYLQPPGLWKNTGGTFQLAPGAGPYFTARHCGRGLASADLDGDTDTDVVVCHQDAPPELLRNDTPPSSSQLQPLMLRLIGTRVLRDPTGAVGVLQEPDRTQTEQIFAGGSYASASDRRLLFVRHSPDSATRLTIRWPGGEESVIENLPPGQRFTIVQNANPEAAPRVFSDF
ncbi:MAG: FG-GAP repeat domain-containing protein [Planctomycetota bacterium]